MTHDEKLELAKKLINEKFNKTLELWQGNDLLTYAWGWRNEDTLSSNHDGQFYYLDQIVLIVKALGLNYTVTVGNNLDGKPTPYIGIF